MKKTFQFLETIKRVNRIFSTLVGDPATDNPSIINKNEDKSFTSDIGGYSYKYGYANKSRQYSNGLTSFEDQYGIIRFSNGGYARKTSENYYYFSDGVTGYESSEGNIILSNGQIIILR